MAQNQFIEKIISVLVNYPDGLTVNEIASLKEFEQYLDTTTDRKKYFSFRNLQRDIQSSLTGYIGSKTAKIYYERSVERAKRKTNNKDGVKVFYLKSDDSESLK